MQEERKIGYNESDCSREHQAAQERKEADHGRTGKIKRSHQKHAGADRKGTVRPEVTYEIVKTAEVQPILEDDGKVRNYSIFPDDENRRFAVYYLELDPDSYWESEPHLRGTTEFITVFSGTVEIKADGKQFQVSEGENIRFKGDTEHSYRNSGEETAVLHMILYNP